MNGIHLTLVYASRFKGTETGRKTQADVRYLDSIPFATSIFRYRPIGELHYRTLRCIYISEVSYSKNFFAHRVSCLWRTTRILHTLLQTQRGLRMIHVCTKGSANVGKGTRPDPATRGITTVTMIQRSKRFETSGSALHFHVQPLNIHGQIFSQQQMLDMQARLEALRQRTGESVKREFKCEPLMSLPMDSNGVIDLTDD